MKRVIVNADDFGLTNAVSRGIIQGAKRGIITSASLMATSECFEEAVDLLKDYPLLDVGVHLTIVDDERPTTRSGDIPLLTKHGHFHNRNMLLFKVLLYGKKILNQIECEFRRQIERILLANIHVTHLDSHQHLHIFPGVSDIILKLSHEYSIPFVRVPYVEENNWSKLPVNLLARALKNKSALNGQILHFRGFTDSGRMCSRRIIKILEELNDGVTEIMVHPGFEDEYTRQKYNHWGYHWEQELDAVCDEKVQQTLYELGIELINYRELKRLSNGAT